MSPLTLTALLLIAQVIAITVPIRRGMWRTIPCWTIYLFVATLHLGTGIIAHVVGQDYPMTLLYFEPLIILGQIALLIQDLDPFLNKWVRVQVPRDREAEARELLEELRQAEAESV